MNKTELFKKLDNAVENFRKDMALFSEDSSTPATEADLHRLSVMTYNALYDLSEAIKNSFD